MSEIIEKACDHRWENAGFIYRDGHYHSAFPIRGQVFRRYYARKLRCVDCDAALVERLGEQHNNWTDEGVKFNAVEGTDKDFKIEDEKENDECPVNPLSRIKM